MKLSPFDFDLKYCTHNTVLNKQCFWCAEKELIKFVLIEGLSKPYFAFIWSCQHCIDKYKNKHITKIHKQQKYLNSLFLLLNL